MVTAKVLEKIAMGGISFERYTPLRFREGQYQLSKDVGPLCIFQQYPDRWGLTIYSKDYTKESTCFYTDYHLTEEEVRSAFSEAFGVIILTEKEFDEQHNAYIGRYRSRYAEIPLSVVYAIREAHKPYIPGPVSPTITVDVTAAQDPEFEYYIEPEAFLNLLDKYGIPQNTDCQYSFIITRTEGKVYSVAGTPDYVMQDRSRKRRKPVRPNCPEWWEFCRAFALKPVSCGFVNATQLLHPDNPMSVFSFSANGGIHTDKFAINLATNHIVPLDHSLDICNHKKGWSYIHQYMGRFAFHWAIDIVTAEREGNRFSLGQEYSMETVEEREWFAKAVHKVCRLLVGFGAPEDSILSVELKDRNTTLAFPVFPVAETQHSLGALLLKRVDISRREVDSPLDKDPLVQEIRRHYILVQKATHDAVSGYELKFLALVKALADSLHIRGESLDTAYMKAYMSRNLADLEIYKELVHSALRKTPLFSAVYGYKADPEAVFVCGKRDA